MANNSYTQRKDKKDEPTGLFLVFGLLASIGFYIFSRKKKEEPGVVIPSGVMTLSVQSGKPESPNLITEGLKQNQGIVSVHNTSVKEVTHQNGSVDDTPVAYTFQVDVEIVCGDQQIISLSGTIGVPASGTEDAVFEFDIPFGLTGAATFTALLNSADGVPLGDPVSINFQIEEVQMTVGGEVTW